MTIGLTVTNATGCSVNSSTNVVVPPPPVAIIQAALRTCANTTNNVALAQDQGPNAAYAWSIDNGTINSGQGTTNIIWTAGTNSVATLSLSVANASGCFASTSLVVAVPCVFTPPDDGVLNTNGTFCQTYNTDADFDLGVMDGVEHNAPKHNQLQLFPVLTTPYVWLPASARGTIIKVDANTGRVLGEYWSSPDFHQTNSDHTVSVQGGHRNPSRTTVDRLGNVWVGNRDEASSINPVGDMGSIIRIGVVQGGVRGNKDSFGRFTPDPEGQYLKGPFDYCTCEDRDGDGYIRTSRYLTDVLDWTNTGEIDSTGGVATAEDECIINYTRVGGINVRTIAVDANNDVWVGGYGNKVHEKLSGVTGQTISGTRTNFNGGGYGGLIDHNGVLWTSNNLLRYDPSTGSLITIGGNYGIGIDPNSGHIWVTEGSVSTNWGVLELDSLGNVISRYTDFTGWGICVDAKSHVWVAGGNAVGHYAPNPTNPALPHVCRGSWRFLTKFMAWQRRSRSGRSGRLTFPGNAARRIDPNGGIVNTNFGVPIPIGTNDLSVDLGSGAGPYNYSDMTGFTAKQLLGHGRSSMMARTRGRGGGWFPGTRARRATRQ